MSRLGIGLGCALLLATQAQAVQGFMVQIPSGNYPPFFPPQVKVGTQAPASEPKRVEIRVESFSMDAYPVTQEDYLKFVQMNPRWRKSNVKELFADSHYLAGWKDDLSPPSDQSRNSPITEVSWFAAKAYCESKGKSLPTVDQWEYIAYDQGKGGQEAQRKILDWYSTPNPKRLKSVKQTRANRFGVHGLYGLVWEWVLDFNNAMVSDEARESGTTDSNLFCGAGSLGALDPSDYASFMRYSFRSSLKANYTTANLGFRCVSESEK